MKDQSLAAGRGDVLPVLAPVDRPDYNSRTLRFGRSVETAGRPHNLAVDNVDPAQVAGGDCLHKTPGW